MHTKTTVSRRSGKAVRLSIDGSLLAQAKRLGLVLSQVLEEGIAPSVRVHASGQWLERNRAALSAYNEHVEEHGVFSDGLRSF